MPAALAAASGAALSTLGARWEGVLAEGWARVAPAYGLVTPPARQAVSARVGLRRAADLPLRFYDPDSPAVSR